MQPVSHPIFGLSRAPLVLAPIESDTSAITDHNVASGDEIPGGLKIEIPRAHTNSIGKVCPARAHSGASHSYYSPAFALAPTSLDSKIYTKSKIGRPGECEDKILRVAICNIDNMKLIGLRHLRLRMRLSAGISILHMQVLCPSPKSFFPNLGCLLRLHDEHLTEFSGSSVVRAFLL